VTEECPGCSVLVSVSHFDDERDTRPVARELTFGELRPHLTRFEVRAEKSGPAWSPVRYADGAARGNAGVEKVYAAVMDVDDGTDPEVVHRLLDNRGYEHVIHSTFSSTPEHPKFRVVVPLANPFSAEGWPAIFPRLCALLTNGHTDPGTKDPARLFFLPSARPGGKTFTYSAHGRAVLPADLPPTTEEPSTSSPGVPLAPTGKLPHGRHYEWLRSFAASFASRTQGATEAQVVEAARAAFGTIGDDLASHESEIPVLARSALGKFGKATPSRPLWVLDERGNERPDRASFVEGVMLEHRFRATRDNDDLFYYRDGFYSPKAKTRIREWVEEQFRSRGETASSAFTTEVIGGVTRRSYIERESFNPPGKLCLENGVLDLASLTVSPHDPELPFTYRLPVRYDPSATCPTFERFISEVVPAEGEREKVRLLFGYCLEPGNRYQVAFLAVGDGNNGKTTALCLLRDLLGAESVSSEILQSLCEGRFGTYSLWGKLANVCTDIPASPIRYTGTFKMLTGGEDSVRAERKFADAFFFTNPAKLVFSANELPPVENDRSYAFWRRWVTIEFPVVLTGREDRDLPLKLRAELPGVLIWALEGLRWLRAAGGFPATPGGLKEDWRRRSEPLYWFVSERARIGPNQEVKKADLYEAYAEFADEKNLPRMEPERVGSLLPKYVPTVRTVKHRVRGTLERFWAGVGLRGDTDPPASPDSPASPAPIEAGEAGETGGSALGPGSHDRARAAVRAAFDQAEQEEAERP
jgi:P4 family phage/plasmid primase-like protien